MRVVTNINRINKLATINKESNPTFTTKLLQDSLLAKQYKGIKLTSSNTNQPNKELSKYLEDLGLNINSADLRINIDTTVRLIDN